MGFKKVFKNQCINEETLKHIKYPIYRTKEFDFFRCVEFKEEFYGALVTDLFKGNLRESQGRYSMLFPNHRISYWADSPMTARAEVKKHGAGCNLLTFQAYDDASSYKPCLGGHEMLCIVDARRTGIQSLIEKIDNGQLLTTEEKRIMEDILNEPIDAIAYESKAYFGGENFIFLEKGFKKLALREIRLRFGRRNGGNSKIIRCAFSSDYVPILESYGMYFLPKCRVGKDLNYLDSIEYKEREKNIERKKFK